MNQPDQWAETWKRMTNGPGLYAAWLLAAAAFGALMMVFYESDMLAIGLMLSAILTVRIRSLTFIYFVYCSLAMLIVFARGNWWTIGVQPGPRLWHSLMWLPPLTVAMCVLSFRCCTFRYPGWPGPTAPGGDTGQVPAGSGGGWLARIATRLRIAWLLRFVVGAARRILPRRRQPKFRADASFRNSELTEVIWRAAITSVISGLAVTVLPQFDSYAGRFGLPPRGLHLVITVLVAAIVFSTALAVLGYFDLRRMPSRTASIAVQRELLHGHLAECRTLVRSRRVRPRRWRRTVKQSS